MVRVRLMTALAVCALASGAAQAQDKPFVPEVGQPGKDVVWVPSPPEMVEKMLDMAKVTPQDFVIDLGSGDGRNVIAAAKRGASALGVEYNPDMVELSKRAAREAGVAEKAQFVQGDMFAADISKASVMALFLLPSNLIQLRDKFLNLKPGTRLVMNTFSVQDWTPDESQTLENCSSWCTSMLYIVPAKVEGTWQRANGTLTLKQTFQMVEGTFTPNNGAPVPVSGRLRGEEITLKAADLQMSGRVTGNAIELMSGGEPMRFTLFTGTP